MTALSGSTEVEAPIGATFDFVANPENDPLWCPRVLWCRQRQGRGLEVGALYEALHRPTLQRRHSRWIEVLEIDSPRRIVTRQSDDVGEFTIVYELEQRGARTLLRQRDEIEWRVPRLFVPVAKLIVGRHIGDQLASLKRLIEADAAAGGLA
jgi:hypothetical protein